MCHNVQMDIEERLKEIPPSPGVYIMKDKGGEVLYIGKAKSLRARVRSYFRETGDTRYAVRFLASRVEEIDYILTANEKEALLLEDTLIKAHKPRYNISLKDSKTYVSIKITVKERFPRVSVTRQVKKDGSRYFGPYTSARAVRETIKLIRKIFPLCTCSPSVFNNRVRPCLDYQMGLCPAPAVGYITEEKYRELVDSAVLFLEGRNMELVNRLRDAMGEAASRLDFEAAARIRDQILSIEEMLEEQKVVSHRHGDQDIFAFLREDRQIAVQAMFVREGRLVSSNPYFFEESGVPDDEVASSFLTQFYRGERFVPDEVIIPFELEDRDVLEDWLSEKKGRKAVIVRPERGDKLKLLRMAVTNAGEALRKRAEARSAKTGLLDELKRRLHLSKTPERIEAFDISNIGGSFAVGAMVSFRGGEPDKSSYRLFRIKGIEGPDDYAMMEHVLSRRFRTNGDGSSKALPLPDLILMDGGKGQMNIALEVLDSLGITGVDVRALAKDRADDYFVRKGIAPKGERVFIPNVKEPVLLREGSKPDLLVRRIRDEVHRFAISYHRRLRSGSIGSILDTVPGIGPRRKKALLKAFGDIGAIRAATVEEIKAAGGLSEGLAREIKEALEGV